MGLQEVKDGKTLREVVEVMALLISSSIICTTDMKPKLWGIPALGAFGYVFAFIIVLYVFLKHFFSRK